MAFGYGQERSRSPAQDLSRAGWSDSTLAALACVQMSIAASISAMDAGRQATMAASIEFDTSMRPCGLRLDADVRTNMTGMLRFEPDASCADWLLRGPGSWQELVTSGPPGYVADVHVLPLTSGATSEPIAKLPATSAFGVCRYGSSGEVCWALIRSVKRGESGASEER